MLLVKTTKPPNLPIVLFVILLYVAGVTLLQPQGFEQVVSGALNVKNMKTPSFLPELTLRRL